MLRTSLRFLLLLTLFASAACTREDRYASVRNLDSRGESIICLGDSLTEGVGAGEGEGYPSLLARQVSAPVVNAGRRGDTTAAALARLEQDVLRRNPRLVIVLLGGNDFLRRIPLEETRENLTRIVQAIQARGAMVVLVGLTLGLFTDEYGPLYAEIARAHGALLIPDVLKGILSDQKLKSDQIHPSGAGYRVMADRIAVELKALLEAAERRRSVTYGK